MGCKAAATATTQETGLKAGHHKIHRLDEGAGGFADDQFSVIEMVRQFRAGEFWPVFCKVLKNRQAVMWRAHLVMDTLLSVFYVIMAVYGYWQWHRGQTGDTEEHLEVAEEARPFGLDDAKGRTRLGVDQPRRRKGWIEHLGRCCEA
jgi:hypothetical protein